MKVFPNLLFTNSVIANTSFSSFNAFSRSSLLKSSKIEFQFIELFAVCPGTTETCLKYWLSIELAKFYYLLL